MYVASTSVIDGQDYLLAQEHETKWGNIISALTTAFDSNENKTSLSVLADMFPKDFTEEKICQFDKGNRPLLKPAARGAQRCS